MWTLRIFTTPTGLSSRSSSMIDLASFMAEGDGAKTDHFSSSIICTDTPRM